MALEQVQLSCHHREVFQVPPVLQELVDCSFHVAAVLDHLGTVHLLDPVVCLLLCLEVGDAELGHLLGEPIRHRDLNEPSHLALDVMRLVDHEKRAGRHVLGEVRVGEHVWKVGNGELALTKVTLRLLVDTVEAALLMEGRVLLLCLQDLLCLLTSVSLLVSARVVAAALDRAHSEALKVPEVLVLEDLLRGHEPRARVEQRGLVDGQAVVEVPCDCDTDSRLPNSRRKLSQDKPLARLK